MYLQNPEQQSQIIDILLNENACLKQLLAACLPDAKGLSDTEMKLARILTGNLSAENSYPEAIVGNNGSNNSNQQPLIGTYKPFISNLQPMAGNYQPDNSRLQLQEGNSKMQNSYQQIEEGINAMQLDIVRENVRLLMKTAILSSHLTTAKILMQLQTDPATPLATLRKLTGLSGDGMAKRIMAMKKAGLLTRLSAPKRYLLTGKAKELFIEKRR